MSLAQFCYNSLWWGPSAFGGCCLSCSGFMRICWLGAKKVPDGGGIIQGQMTVTLSAPGSFSGPGLKFMLCYLRLSLRPCQVHVGSYSACSISLCAAQLGLCLISPPLFPFPFKRHLSVFLIQVWLCPLPCVKLPCPPYHSSSLAHSPPYLPFSIHLGFLSASMGCPLLLPLP